MGKITYGENHTDEKPNKALLRTPHKVRRPENADVRTENERCGTRQSKGATATRLRW